ncbi:olfactory receptor 1019-like [Sander lucioperca]|uniref:olfactory receptor 1019-like n=1 Tax=Sander lucioperca TaxID=283035 RepID=UPI00125D9826|nr:olfactory receptor 1019-like [Sander lucioperca]
MKSNSSLNPLYFQFTLFVDFGPLRYLFFSLCLLLYMTAVSANIVIILTVCLEKSLHQPMYIFICCLSFNSLYGSAGFFPRFLTDILSDTHLISRPLCFIQIYVIYTYASCEVTILSIMAYDRFVAICQPLHYHSKMTFKMVTHLVIFAVLYPAFAVGFMLYLTVRLPLCGNKLNRLFCSNWPVVLLSCVDTTLNNIVGQFVTITTIFIIHHSSLFPFGSIPANQIHNIPEQTSTTTTSSDSDSVPSSSPTEPSSVSPQPPASPPQPLSTQLPPPVSAVCGSPLSMLPESPVSRVGLKRKRNPDDWLVKQMAQLDERRMDLQEKLVQDTGDECSRFAQAPADLLRKVPEGRRSDVMFNVYKMLYDSRHD